MSDAFFEMVKKWTINDYHTPGSKAEIIIDMLISEFVCDIIKDSNEVKVDGILDFVAKEFPIKAITETSKGNWKISEHNRPARVDFLLSDESTLYFVELKTDSKSYEDEQLLRMIYAAVKHTTDDDYTYSTLCEITNASSSKKYRRYVKENWKDLFSKKKIRIVYLTLNGVGNHREEKQMILTEGKNQLIMTREKGNDLSTIHVEWNGRDQDIDIKQCLLLDYKTENSQWKNVKTILEGCIDNA